MQSNQEYLDNDISPERQKEIREALFSFCREQSFTVNETTLCIAMLWARLERRQKEFSSDEVMWDRR